MDYFELLGVSRQAGADEVKQAYRQKARLLHPDLNPAPDAAERFRELTTAYTVLSDPQQRDAYIRAQLASLSPSPPRRLPRRKKSYMVTLNVGMLVVGLIILMWGGDHAAFAWLSRPETCRVVQVGGERIWFELVNPRPEGSYVTYHEFRDARENIYQHDQRFICYFSPHWDLLEFKRFRNTSLAGLAFWMSFAGMMVWRAGVFLLS